MIDYLILMKRYNLIYDKRIHWKYDNFISICTNKPKRMQNFIQFTDYGQPMLRYNEINIYDVDQIKLTWNAVSEELITKLENLELLKNKI